MTAPGTNLDDVIIYFRRYVKEGDTATLKDNTIIDYINRFYLYKMPQRLQLWDLKRQFFIDTIPDINYYLFPINDYQMIVQPIYVDGIEIGYYQSNSEFYRSYPEQMMNEQPIISDGIPPYTTTLTNFPIMRSFFDKPNTGENLNRYRIANFIVSAQDDNGVTQYAVDNGVTNLVQVDNQFQNVTTPPNENIGNIDYATGVLSINFPETIPVGNLITVQSIPYAASRPVGVLFTNNYLKIYPVPDRVYRLQFQAIATPAMFLKTNSDGDNSTDSQQLPWRHMSEYIALGSAILFMKEMRKEDQLRFYLPFFQEEEVELLRRTSRQEDTQRTGTLFSQQTDTFFNNFYNQY